MAGQASNRLRVVNAAQQRISRRIEGIKKQLKSLRDSPSTQPWVSFKRVSNVSELLGSHANIKDALRCDLQTLKAQLRDLHRQSGRLKYKVMQQNAARARTNFQNMATKTLNQVANRQLEGKEFDEGRLNALVKESERVLGMYVNILEANPSERNIRGVLKQLEDALLLGGGDPGGTSDRAFQSMAKASDKLHTKADKAFRKNPTSEKFAETLHSMGTSMLLGGNASMSDTPEGWSSVGTVHTVVKGDSLSAISLQYYGKACYWDIIYVRNCSIIGNRPEDLRNLKIGLKLDIP